MAHFTAGRDGASLRRTCRAHLHAACAFRPQGGLVGIAFGRYGDKPRGTASTRRRLALVADSQEEPSSTGRTSQEVDVTLRRRHLSKGVESGLVRAAPIQPPDVSGGTVS